VLHKLLQKSLKLLHKVLQPSATIKEFEVGDRVRILDSGLHHEKDGKVVAVNFGRVDNDYRIALDKESPLSREVILTVPHSQQFPILMKL